MGRLLCRSVEVLSNPRAVRTCIYSPSIYVSKTKGTAILIAHAKIHTFLVELATMTRGERLLEYIALHTSYIHSCWKPLYGFEGALPSPGYKLSTYYGKASSSCPSICKASQQSCLEQTIRRWYQYDTGIFSLPQTNLLDHTVLPDLPCRNGAGLGTRKTGIIMNIFFLPFGSGYY
jgi:hypothetical protein